MAYVYRGTIRDVKEINEIPAEPVVPRKQFNPEKCGTYAGYRQHKHHKDTPCRECLDAKKAYNRAWEAKRAAEGPAPRPAFNPDKCGTYAGYLRHMRYTTTTCVPCKAAHSKYMADYRAKRKAQELEDAKAA